MPANDSVWTLGGDDQRNHYHRSQMAHSLCLQTRLPVGRTLSQPLIVRYAPTTVAQEYVVFHLGNQHLYVRTLDGEWIATHRVQDRYSWGSITYAARDPNSPDPARDTLYVATGADGEGKLWLRAFRVADLLKPSGSGSPLQPLGELQFEGRGIVSAPLYMGDDGQGRDRIVLSVVENRLYIVKNLANNNGNRGLIPPPIRWTAPGWDSGTATRLKYRDGMDSNFFAVAAGRTEAGRGILRIFAVEGMDRTGVHWRDFDQPTDPIGIQREDIFDSEGLSQMPLDKREVSQLYAADKNGSVYRIDVRQGNARSAKHFSGFANTGPATDGDVIFFGSRWEGSTTSTHTTGSSDAGRLFAVRKDTLSLLASRPLIAEPGAPAGDTWPTSAALGARSGRYSWINVSPTIWEDSGGQLAGRLPKVVLVGDARGYVSAWEYQLATEPAVLRDRPFFLNRGNTFEPALCSEIERADDAYLPDFNLYNRTRLTANPAATAGEQAWYNTQGTATEMSVIQGRLLTGYIEAGDPENTGDSTRSSMVIFRNATNLYLKDLEVSVQGAGGWQPLPKGAALPVTAPLRVTVPVVLEGDPLAPPRSVTVVAGWTGGSVQSRVVQIHPFQTERVEFMLGPAPAGSDPQLLAVVNPALFRTRRDHEEARGMLPPTMGEQAERIPEAWLASPLWQAAAAAKETGEVWALDNARSWGGENRCNLTVRLESPVAGADVDRHGFTSTVAVTRHQCPALRSATVTLTGYEGFRQAEFGSDETTVQMNFRVSGLACGPFTLRAEVDHRNRIREVNEWDNTDEREIFAGGHGCAPQVKEPDCNRNPVDCRGSKPVAP